jgi:hypothetical protein
LILHLACHCSCFFLLISVHGLQVGLEVRKTVRKLRLARKLSPSHAIGSTRAYGQNTYDQHTTTKFVIQQLIDDTSCCWVYEFYFFYWWIGETRLDLDHSYELVCCLWRFLRVVVRVVVHGGSSYMRKGLNKLILCDWLGEI